MDIFRNTIKSRLFRIGFGGIPIQRLNELDAVKLLLYAFSRGINFIDTARGYTDSESKTGLALEEYGEEIFIATKSMARTYSDMKRDIEISLNELKQDKIHLYQLHCINKAEDLEKAIDMQSGALRAMMEAKRSKKIIHVGITGHIPHMLAEALKTNLFGSVQVPHNIIETGCEEELLPLASSMGIPVIAMKPIAGGALKKIELNLRYILNNGTDIAVCGMDSPEQVDRNLSVLPEIRGLDESEMSALLEERDLWKGEFCRRCEYCMPCPQGLNIPFLLLLIAYWERYKLKDWVLQRLSALEKKFDDCIKCGECEKKCPYDLHIIEMMKKGSDIIKEP